MMVQPNEKLTKKFYTFQDEEESNGGFDLPPSWVDPIYISARGNSFHGSSLEHDIQCIHI